MSSGVNLVMTVIGFTVSTTFIVFVCTRLICARIQLSYSRRSLSISSRSDPSTIERGLESVVVAKFPTKKYGDPFFPSSQDSQCIVCLAEYGEDDTVRILPFCGHSFHSNCIDIWLQQRSTCPVCRISLRDQCPDKKRAMLQPLFSSPVRSHTQHRYNHLNYNRMVLSRDHDNRRFRDSDTRNVSILIHHQGTETAIRSSDKHVESPSTA